MLHFEPLHQFLCFSPIYNAVPSDILQSLRIYSPLLESQDGLAIRMATSKRKVMIPENNSLKGRIFLGKQDAYLEQFRIPSFGPFGRHFRPLHLRHLLPFADSSALFPPRILGYLSAMIYTSAGCAFPIRSTNNLAFLFMILFLLAMIRNV